MKYVPLLLLMASCGPYYVGAKPVDVAKELIAARPVVVAEPASSEPQVAEPEVPAGPAPLIGWDGKEVDDNDRPLHGIDMGEDTHGNLLSMYMDSKQEVDQLKLELAAMADLQAKQDTLLEARQLEITKRDMKITALEGELATERLQGKDLEARLVTAQIRRLEAEKQLLLNILGVEPEDTKSTDETMAQVGQ